MYFCGGWGWGVVNQSGTALPTPSSYSLKVTGWGCELAGRHWFCGTTLIVRYDREGWEVVILFYLVVILHLTGSETQNKYEAEYVKKVWDFSICPYTYWIENPWSLNTVCMSYQVWFKLGKQFSQKCHPGAFNPYLSHMEKGTKLTLISGQQK